jgi:Protein of unknown function (DUF2510)
MPLPAAAWYADPHDPTRIRWWDGNAWSEHVRERPAAPPVSPSMPDTTAEAAPSEATAPLVSASFDAPVADASVLEALTPPAPVPPSPFGPLASATPVAPLEPPRTFSTTPATPTAPVEPAATFSPVGPIEPIEATRTFSPVGPIEATRTFSPVEPIAPFDTPRPFSPVESVDAPRAFSPVPPLEPVPAAATSAHRLPLDDAPSIGATRLPPMGTGSTMLPPPPPPMLPSQDVSITPHGAGRRVRLALVGLVVVAIAAGVGVLAMGRIGSITGNDAREPSSAELEVYRGNGYSFELPKAWVKVDGSEIAQIAALKTVFATQTGSVLVVVDEPTTGTVANLDDPVTRQAIVNRTLQSADPTLKVLSQEATEIGGAHGIHLVASGTASPGGAYQDDLYLAVGDRATLGLVLVTPGTSVDPTVTQQLQQIVASVRFD